MSTVVLSVNAGSSSLKTTLFVYGKDRQLKCLAKAEVSNISSQPALKYNSPAVREKNDKSNIQDHKAAFACALEAFLKDDGVKEVNSKDDIDYVCHRVVHGGDFHETQVINNETFHKLEALEDLAPLHNKSAVDLISICTQDLPNTTNFACFDSQFHYTLPSHVKAYMIDQKIAEEKGLRKYGFHGLSYSYITRAVASYLGKSVTDTSLIALHLGSGASVCAIQNGKSIDTSMGLTPVSGLPGSSRSGDIDPALIFHYTSEAGKLSPKSTKDLHISTAEDILNKQSGWNALTGTSDFAEIAKPDAPATHQLALNIFVDRIVGFIGNYYVKLGGKVDALVFAGGIGEKSALLRQTVTKEVECLGFAIDSMKNESLEGNGPVFDISKKAYKQTLVCETDEDYEMAYSVMTNLN